MNKRQLRQEIYKERDSLTQEQIRDKSAKIGERLFSLPSFQQASTVMFFLSFRSEVDTRPMVEQCLLAGKKVLVPKAEAESRRLIPSQILNWDQDLELGYYDIPEPKADALRLVEPGEIDLLIVPGVGFDEQGNRLGYGGGFYDRFFPLLRPEVPLVALAFELQIKENIPVEEWDRQVDLVITEDRIIAPGEN